MIYTISYSPLALEHLDFWKKSGNKSVLQKIVKMVDELAVHPETGTGKPERLKGDMSGKWSRRINKKDRLVYSIHDKDILVEIVSAYGHYSLISNKMSLM